MLPLLLLLAGHCSAAAARGGQFGHGLRTQNRVISKTQKHFTVREKYFPLLKNISRLSKIILCAGPSGVWAVSIRGHIGRHHGAVQPLLHSLHLPHRVCLGNTIWCWNYTPTLPLSTSGVLQAAL